MTSVDDARARLEAGDYAAAHEAATQALAQAPDDIELLRVAGLAGVEIGAGDAVDQLRKVADARPDNAQAWHDLGDALATEGRTEEASEAFARAVELNPEDEVALAQLGHSAAATGQGEDAVSYLSQAAERTHGASTAAISLVDMYRTLGQHEEALAAAEKVAAADPADVMAALDVAELSLTVGRLDDAVKAYERMREIEDLPDHEVYALHGMLQVELAREDWERALEVARQAQAVDPHGRTLDVIAFLDAQTGGESEEPPPSREEVDAALQASSSEHRRAHGEDRRLTGGEPLG